MNISFGLVPRFFLLGFVWHGWKRRDVCSIYLPFFQISFGRND